MSALIDRCRRSTDEWQGVRSAGERARWIALQAAWEASHLRAGIYERHRRYLAGAAHPIGTPERAASDTSRMRHDDRDRREAAELDYYATFMRAVAARCSD